MASVGVSSVHPHMRGDNSGLLILLLFYPRFTPTCVGTITGTVPVCGYVSVHPHMRGDNLKMLQAIPGSTGSPPHAWGQSPRRPQRRGRTRFTPTCVGTMTGGLGQGRVALVHPHMRGDNDGTQAYPSVATGSPPHAWGQFHTHAERLRNTRFTPTCVGTMPRSCRRLARDPVHPHMRGDNEARQLVALPLSGSPPHAWGQCRRTDTATDTMRFTPTCVGTMAPPSDQSCSPAVHPHMRGDNGAPSFLRPLPLGSPPHAWGQ